MKRAFLYLALVLAGAVPAAFQGGTPGTAAGQDIAFGVIQGTVTRQGTADPIPDVKVSVALTAAQARSLLDAAARGTTGIPDAVLTAARGTGVRGAATPGPITATSDASGRFELTVPAGTVTVSAECEGYFGPIANGTSPTIVTTTATVSARQTVAVRLSMIAGGTINGIVMGANGKPVSDAPVGVIRRAYHRGLPAIDLVDGKTTDDRGAYRLYRLAPGEYFVVALASRATPAGAAAAAAAKGDAAVNTFYPNALDVASARPVVVNSGDDLAGIDIQVRTSLMFSVSGRVTSTLPAGSEISALNNAARQPIAQIILLPRDPIVVPDVLRGPTAASADGSFEVAGVPQGTYDLIARLPVSRGWGPQNSPERATNPWAFGRTTVEVGGANVEGVNVVVHQGVDLKGRVTVDGNPAGVNLRVLLQPDDNTAAYNPYFDTISNYAPAIDQAGSFTIPLLPEGRYRFVFSVGASGVAGRGTAPATAAVVPLPATAYVADVRQNGISVYDTGLTITVDPSDPIEVIVKTDAGSVDGTVSGQDQKPAADKTVVLVPDQRRQNVSLYRFSTSDAQGHFTIARVPPGSYKIFSWDSVVDGAWANPAFLQPYEARGVAVVVGPSARTSMDVKAIRADR